MNKSSFLPYKDILSLIDKIDNIIVQYEGKNDDTNSYCNNCLTTAESTNSVSTYYPLITYGSNSSTKSAPFSNKKIIHTLLKNNPFKQDSKESLQVINYMIMANYDSLSDRRDNKSKTVISTKHITPLSTPQYEYEEEIENINIIYKRNKEIKYITVDLFLTKIATNQNKEFITNRVMESFIEQCEGFIHIEILIKKVIYAFFFFYSGYTANYKNFVFPYGLLDFFLLICEYTHKYNIFLSLEIQQQMDSFFQQLSTIKCIKDDCKERINIIYNKCFIHDTSIFGFDDDDDWLDNRICQTSPNVSENEIKKYDILKENSNSIAKKLTDITNNLLSKVTPKELIPSIKKKDLTAPYVYQLIQQANKLNLFIIEEILSYDHKSMRAKVIEKFIQIANGLYMMNNFNDLLTVVSALGSFIIQNNLSKSWNAVNKKYKEIYNYLKEIVTFEDSYKTIREMSAKCYENKIKFTPYIGLTLKRLAFLEEKSKYIKNSKLINMEKIILVDKVIKEFMSYKKLVGKNIKILCYYKDEIINHRYTDNSNMIIYDNLNPRNENELIALSKNIEPSFRLYTKKSNEKRRTKTDKEVYG